MDVQGDDGEAIGDHEMARSRQQRQQRWMEGVERGIALGAL